MTFNNFLTKSQSDARTWYLVSMQAPEHAKDLLGVFRVNRYLLFELGCGAINKSKARPIVSTVCFAEMRFGS